MMRALRSPRRAAVAISLVVAATFGVPTVVAGQADDAAAVSAILSQDGWWNRAKGPVPNEPTNPLRPAIGGALPAPSTVPASGLGVGAVAGDPDKVAAIGLVLDAPPDALVDTFVLRLQETPENGSNLNAASARILACPITGFWSGVKDGDFANRPTCDDSQSVAGERAADGSWTFDLTLLASQWIDPASGLDQNGVLLMEAVDAPQSFQVSFSDISTGKVTFDFSATALFGDEVFTEDTTFGQEVATTDDAFTDTGDTGFALDDSAGSFDTGSSSSFTPTPRTRAVTPTTAAVPVAPQVATPAATARPIAVGGDLFGSLPVAALVFLALLVLGGALFLGLVLGPLAAPTVEVARSGGVSRALAARAARSTR